MHIGVCDPWDSPKCQAMNGSVQCDATLSCEAAYKPGQYLLSLFLYIQKYTFQNATV